MAKKTRFNNLQLRNFTVHRDLAVNYGNVTRLSGRNGVGKSSIGTSPVWVLWGTDLFGKKFDPSPVTYEFESVFASLTLTVDGTEYKFGREIENGTNRFYLDGVPAKAKEFEVAVAALFDRDEFLSFYNPQYFFTLHWTKQREMILRYTLPPARTEVLKNLPELVSAKLSELLKKHSLDDLQKIHSGTGGQKSKLEKQHIAAKSRTQTLEEQLTAAERSMQIESIEAAQAEIAKIDAQIAELNAAVEVEQKQIRKHVELDTAIRSLLQQRDQKKKQYMDLRDEEIADTCRTCQQPLKGDAVSAARADKDRRIAAFKAEYDEVVAKRKELEDQLSAMELVDITEKLDEIRSLQESKQALVEAVKADDQKQKLANQVAEATKAEADILVSLKESVFILDAIKSYRAKEAELQAAKVQSLFTTLSIRLFKYVKSSDEWEPDFSIQMDGKDYVQLSAGERYAAGLELGEVLFKQSEMIVPVFIDGIESYTGPVAVFDQLITGRAVLDQDLKIETEGATA